jgi:hypothetical protein
VAYRNDTHEKRLVLMPVVEDAFATLSMESTKGARKDVLAESTPPQTIYITPDVIAGSEETRHVYNFPFLLNADGSAWHEANSHLLELVEHEHINDRPTDKVRVKATRILDYKVYCEKEGLNWLDFTSRRKSGRPTYRYFKHLIKDPKKSSATVNQYTAAIYGLYEHVSKKWHSHIDMELVDTVETVKALFHTPTGAVRKEVRKRGQTKSTPPVSTVPIGYVRDDGEDLRPLKNEQRSELIRIASTEDFTQEDRLMLAFAMDVGARKQTILTFKKRHLDLFTEANLRGDEYLIIAGPGTGIDTKYNKKQSLYVPTEFAQQMKVYAASRAYKKRLGKHRSKMELALDAHFDDSNAYLFLSDRGECYYMSKDDPRYPFVRSPQRGQVATTLAKRILGKASRDFPIDFTLHWLRATYAYRLYQVLGLQVDAGTLTPTKQIEEIQRRLNHTNRETTELYLKLFEITDARIVAQNLYEESIFPQVSK